MQIFVNTKYDFVKWRFHAVAFSVIVVIIGAGLYLKNGINWGIDFAGGANITLRFRDTVPMEKLRRDLPDASIQQYGPAEQRGLLIRLPQQGREGDYAGQTVAKIYKDLNPDAGNRVDLNFSGRDRIADLLFTADPDHKGTNDDAHKYYGAVAQNIINKRSELGIYTNTNQAEIGRASCRERV